MYKTKISLLMKLYRKRELDNVVIFILFSLLAAVISMVLLVQSNNSSLFQRQLVASGLISGDVEIAVINTENILGIIAISAIIVGAVGGLSLIGFRNSNAIKALVMMNICGMQMKDIILKALIDTVIFAIPATVIGHMTGYMLFKHFTRTILVSEQLVKLFSIAAGGVLLKTFILIAFVIIFGNLFFDIKVTEQSPTEYLYNRRGKSVKYYHIGILIIELLGIVLYSFIFFNIKSDYIAISMIVILLLVGVLFILFHLFFGIFTRKKRHNLKISTLKDISFCFLCSRNRRDAMLAVVISVGTIILCIGANILFNISGILRSAYRDNMGYTSVVFVEDSEQKDQIKEILDENDYFYTLGYSKLMDYSELKGMETEEGQLWALIIDIQTDHNIHFTVPKGTFLSENYFENRCNLVPSGYTDIFGSHITYSGSLTDNQYMSLISYNFLINKSDFKLNIDESFHPVFMLDLSEKEEQELKQLLEGKMCHIDSASELIDELKTVLKEYLDILAVVVCMIVIVTMAIFYTIISEDLKKRKSEMYLYRIYGASFEKTHRIIFMEYLMIGLVSSFAVSFTVMFWGELYFYFGLGKHFPLSIPVMLITTGCAVAFVFVCCRVAGFINERTVGLEVIRDE